MAAEYDALYRQLLGLQAVPRIAEVVG